MTDRIDDITRRHWSETITKAPSHVHDAIDRLDTLIEGVYNGRNRMTVQWYTEVGNLMETIRHGVKK